MYSALACLVYNFFTTSGGPILNISLKNINIHSSWQTVYRVIYMARGASALGHITWFCDYLAGAHSLNHAWKSSKYKYTVLFFFLSPTHACSYCKGTVRAIIQMTHACTSSRLWEKCYWYAEHNSSGMSGYLKKKSHQNSDSKTSLTRRFGFYVWSGTHAWSLKYRIIRII